MKNIIFFTYLTTYVSVYRYLPYYPYKCILIHLSTCKCAYIKIHLSNKHSMPAFINFPSRGCVFFFFFFLLYTVFSCVINNGIEMQPKKKKQGGGLRSALLPHLRTITKLFYHNANNNNIVASSFFFFLFFVQCGCLIRPS